MIFKIGDKVKLQSYIPWIGDYEASGTIIGFGNVFLNGVPTYTVETDRETLHEISAERIRLDIEQERVEKTNDF